MPNHIYDIIRDKALARREKWNTIYTDLLPPPEWMDETTIVSIYSRTGLTSKTRYLLNSPLVTLEYLSPSESLRETPSALARDYIVNKYKSGPKWTTAQKDAIYQELVDHPLYCRPTTFSHGYYIDIASAYWSVMVRCGWDVNYYPGKWVGVSIPPLDFPFSDDKRARNCLVSVARATQFKMWSPDKGTYRMNRGNPRANTQLYALITDCLNGIASEAIAAGAVYCFTDGFIAPNSKIASKVMEIIFSWGFYPRIHAEGEGFVNGLGSYIVGNKRTKQIQTEATQYKSVKELSYHSWLRNRMAWTRSQAPWHDNFVIKPIQALRYMPEKGCNYSNT